MQYKIPSFNTVQTPVNDATSLLDPYEIRNMGPSRTLVLINACMEGIFVNCPQAPRHDRNAPHVGI